MGDINHFSHKDHPLKLIEEWKTIMGCDNGGNDEKIEVLCCFGCQEPISGDSAYGCISCRYFLHKTCAQLEPTVNYHYHPQHSLFLEVNKSKSCWCDGCGCEVPRKLFAYYCSPCNYIICVECANVVKAIAALKEEASIKLEHEGHPEHTLSLQLRRAAFYCNACRTEDKDFFYQCDGCDFWIHKTCATLEPTIDLPHHHNHTLLLVYSLPDNFYNFMYYCDFCNKFIIRREWLYHCANCRYFAHIKCALNAKQHSTPRDDSGTSDDKRQSNYHDLLHFPMPTAFTEPLKLLHFEMITSDDCDDDPIELNHWSHNHLLILNVDPLGNNVLDTDSDDPIKVCYGCVRPISFPYYSCKDGCSIFIHKYCVELPRTLEHQLHPNHSLNLVNFEDSHLPLNACDGCFLYGNAFMYNCETCNFYLDVNCAFLPKTIKHERHNHPLVQVIDPELDCKACDFSSRGISYTCKECNFQLDLYCALKSPHSIAHRHCKGHPVPLIYPPVEDHPQDFYCDICEEEMHPKMWMYYCHKCDSTFHPYCIGQGDLYANTIYGGTITGSYHKHPITFVRRKKTPRYVCFGCNRDINGRLILECQTGTCPFRICFRCWLRKT